MTEGDMKHSDLTERDLFTHEVDVNLDVLHTAMMNRAGCHIDDTHIVAEDNHSMLEWMMKFLKKSVNPTTFSNNMGDNTILGFHTRPRDRGLALTRLGDENLGSRPNLRQSKQ